MTKCICTLQFIGKEREREREVHQGHQLCSINVSLPSGLASEITLLRLYTVLDLPRSCSFSLQGGISYENLTHLLKFSYSWKQY